MNLTLSQFSLNNHLHPQWPCIIKEIAAFFELYFYLPVQNRLSLTGSSGNHNFYGVQRPTRYVVWVMTFPLQCKKVRTRCWSVVIEMNFRRKYHFLYLHESVLLYFTIFSCSKLIFSVRAQYKVSWRRKSTHMLPSWACPVVHSKQLNGSRSEDVIPLLGFSSNLVCRLPPPHLFLLWCGWKWGEGHLQMHTACGTSA